MTLPADVHEEDRALNLDFSSTFEHAMGKTYPPQRGRWWETEDAERLTTSLSSCSVSLLPNIGCLEMRMMDGSPSDEPGVCAQSSTCPAPTRKTPAFTRRLHSICGRRRSQQRDRDLDCSNACERRAAARGSDRRPSLGPNVVEVPSHKKICVRRHLVPSRPVTAV
ncbi:hypothetical protein [Cupriavidus oxalaticus]|uniref:hypothetical protein n=1 Tax=Cupriavidus oxalaticus TaxID=96344 RepID=UPI00338DB67D